MSFMVDLDLRQVTTRKPKTVYIIGKVKKNNIADFWTTRRIFPCLSNNGRVMVIGEWNRFDGCSSSFYLGTERKDRIENLLEHEFNKSCPNSEDVEKFLMSELGYNYKVFSTLNAAFSVREKLKESDHKAEKFIYFVLEAEIPKNDMYIEGFTLSVDFPSPYRFPEESDDFLYSDSTVYSILCRGIVLKKIISPTKEDLITFWNK